MSVVFIYDIILYFILFYLFIYISALFDYIFCRLFTVVFLFYCGISVPLVAPILYVVHALVSAILL